MVPCSSKIKEYKGVITYGQKYIRKVGGKREIWLCKSEHSTARSEGTIESIKRRKL